MGEMSSEHVSEWIAAYHDGELRGDRLIKVEAHLAHCDACQAALEELQTLSALLQSSPPPELRTSPERFASQVMLQLPRSIEKPPQYRVLKGFWKAAPLTILAGWAFVEAAVLVTVAIQILFGNFLPTVLPFGPFSMLPIDRSLASLLMPVVEILVVEIVLTLFVAGLMWGWLASWWAIKKV